MEVDVESIVFDCVDSDGLSITHADADHCYSSIDKAWLWQQQKKKKNYGNLFNVARRTGRGVENIPKKQTNPNNNNNNKQTEEERERRTTLLYNWTR